MTTKLGKTATRILTHMQTRHGRYAATRAVGRTKKGGWVRNEGAREFAAAEELIAKGYATLIDRRTYNITERGYGQLVAEIAIALKA